MLVKVTEFIGADETSLKLPKEITPANIAANSAAFCCTFIDEERNAGFYI